MGGTGHSAVDWGRYAREQELGLAIQDGDTVVYASAELSALLGRERSELVGTRWRTLFTSETVDRLQGVAVNTASRDGHWRGEGELESPDGAVPVDLELRRVGGDVLVWLVVQRRSADGRTESHGRSAVFYRRPGFVRTVLDELDDVLYVIDEAGEPDYWNEALVETTGYDHDEIASMHPVELVPDDQREFVPGLLDAIESIEDRRVEVDILAADDSRITHEFKGTSFEDPATGDSYRCGLARDVTERNARERELERHRDELATLDRITELLLGTVQDLLLLRSGRDAVERRLCERLTASEFYGLAWVGERELDGDRIRPRVTAGEGAGYLEEVTITYDQTPTGQGPAGRAVRTGEVHVANVDDPTFSPWRAAARKRGFESVAAVPLQHQDTVYGVLVVYATREDGFTSREQDGFDVIGRTVGAVIHADRTHDLLYAEDVLEVEFDITDVDSSLVEAASLVDGVLRFDGYVDAGGRWLVYCSVEDADPDRVAETVAGEPAIDHCRVLTTAGATPRIEVVQRAPSLFDAITDAGAGIRSGTVTPTSARLTIGVPAAGDVRSIVRDVQATYPAATVIAHRADHDDVANGGRPPGVLDDLTDRQRAILESAYRAGYFAWPRETTAEELADALDLAPPTVHAHLRKAEDRLLTALFDEP